ncbi:MAG: response regulator [Sulfuricella denitrificans]|nr:response regulator [Sulfuricella denitrificans]
MSRQPLIWVIDDDAELRKLLDDYLVSQGFAVRTFSDGRDLERRLGRERPGLLVLDLMMPGDSGLEICSRLRASGDDIPIIMLTAKNDPIDRVIGIEMGADDYLGKPFLPRELTARIHSVLRRRAPLPAGAPIANGNAFVFGEYRLDLAARALWRGEARLEMTGGEFSLLAAFVRHLHQPLSRERLIELARGPGSETTDRSIDVQISRLRKLIEPDPAKPRYIQTVWGFGYVFVPDAAEPAA